MLIDTLKNEWHIDDDILPQVLRMLSNTLPSEPDSRDLTHDERKPDKVFTDNMRHVGLIENQKQEPICVAQSCEVIARVPTNKARGYDREDGPMLADFNARSFYFDTLKRHDGMPNVAGARPRDGMKYLRKYGIQEIRPRQEVFQIKKYWRCRNWREAKNAILTTGPVLAAFHCYESLFKCKGILDKPKQAEFKFGLHAQALVDVNEDGFYVVGSWGMGFANCGTFFMPFEVYPDWITEAWGSTPNI